MKKIPNVLYIPTMKNMFTQAAEKDGKQYIAHQLVSWKSDVLACIPCCLIQVLRKVFVEGIAIGLSGYFLLVSCCYV